ncbi:hypothetical protein AAEX28_07235 [Lentisphaerota bacterium WC36G]|nr:hypothetical protein LJT99_10100 [Lentisphaerae bacterium WC36]UDQ99311.1 hypothetical protein LJT99_07175 [Lentisphaerae bacterium WC36]UDQ99406.1 hypothetical protein LJT99_07655 [Lentisphaerae bacterium WC36]
MCEECQEIAGMKPLFVPLKKQFFEAFKSGEKTAEYRKISNNFNLKTCKIGRKVTLAKGYTKERLSGIIKSVEICHKPNSLPGWVECYGENEPKAIIINIEVE